MSDELKDAESSSEDDVSARRYGAAAEVAAATTVVHTGFTKSTINPSTAPVSFRCKMVLLGDSGVGKTQFMHAITSLPTDKIASQKELPGAEATIGVDFRIVNSVINDREVVRTVLWDTAGQERFATLIPSYLREADAIIVMYDVTGLKSFASLDSRWLKLVNNHRRATPSMVVMLVANKIDLINERIVSARMGLDYAMTHNFDAYCETSALDRSTVHKVVDKAIGIVYILRKHIAQPPESIVVGTPNKKHSCCS